jgi:hypothetical protein
MMTDLRREARTAWLPLLEPHERAQRLAIVGGIAAGVVVEIHQSA